MSNFKKCFIFGIVILVLCIVCNLCIVNWNLAYSQDSSKEDESLFVAKKAFEDGFYDVSLGLLERFLKNYPASEKTPQVRLLIGQCYFHQSKFLDALAKFEELLDEPSYRGIQDAVNYWIAEVHFRGNNFAKAAEYYDKVIKEYPKSSYAPTAYYSLGWCLFEQNDFPGALKYFRSVEEKFPKEPLAQESAYKAVECLYSAKNYQGTKDALKAYFKKYPRDLARMSSLYFYLAEADYYLGNLNDAVAEYSKAAAGSKDEKMAALSQLGIGWSLLKMKKYKEADEAFLQVNQKNLERANLDTLLLGRAMILAEDKRFNEARKIYEDLLQNTGDKVILAQSYLGKAEMLYNAAEYKTAIDTYRQALADAQISDFQDFLDKLHYGLAWAYLKDGQFKEAIEEFQKVAKQSEEKTVKVSALCQIGDAYQDSGDFSRAIEVYDNILKDYPESFYNDYVQYQLGVSLLKTGNYDGAIMAFQSLKGHYPNSKLIDDASYALGLSYFQRENYSAAKEIFEKFEKEFKDSSLSAQATYLLGTSLYNLGKFQEAIEVYKEVIRAHSQDSELVQKSEYEIADCFYQMGNEKEAMTRFKLLRTKYPDSKLAPEVVWWLGEYYYRNNDLTMARRYFSSLVQDFPKSSLIPNAYYALGSTYQEDGQYQQAIDNFKKVIELGNTGLGAQAAIAVADVYVKEEKADLALAAYKDVLKDNSSLAYLIYPKMADIYRNRNDYAQALEFYRKSLDIAPARLMGDIQFKIAQTLQEQGKSEEAIGEYLKAAYLSPDDKKLAVKALLRVGVIYEEKRNFKEATNIYQKIIAMNVEEAKFAQERIEGIRARKK